MWAQRRRVITILIIIGAFLLTVVLPYWLTHQVVPTCTDGEKNQDEIGIDCGGACQLVCPGGAKEITILWTKVFPVRQGVYNIAAYVENPNYDIAAPNLPYIAKLYDAKGTVIAEETGETYASPNERFAIFKGGMLTGENVAVKGSIEIPNTFRWLTMKKDPQTFTIENKVLVDSDRRPKLTALLKNESPEVRRNVEVTAIIYDSQRQPIGISSTYVEKIDKNATEKLFFTWNSAFNYVSETTQCELPVDVVLVGDRSGSMVDDNKLESAKNGATLFVSRLSLKDQASYVSFATLASSPIDQPLTSDFERVKRAIGKTAIKQNDGLQYTNIGGGIQAAINELASNRHDEESRPVIVLLTDGLPTRPLDPLDNKNKGYAGEYARKIAADARSQKISLYAIGLGGDVDSAFLSTLTESPDFYYKAATGAELNDVYNQIARAICKKGPSIIEIIPRINNAR